MSGCLHYPTLEQEEDGATNWQSFAYVLFGSFLTLLKCITWCVGSFASNIQLRIYGIAVRAILSHVMFHLTLLLSVM